MRGREPRKASIIVTLVREIDVRFVPSATLFPKRRSYMSFPRYSVLKELTRGNTRALELGGIALNMLNLFLQSAPRTLAFQYFPPHHPSSDIILLSARIPYITPEAFFRIRRGVRRCYCYDSSVNDHSLQAHLTESGLSSYGADIFSTFFVSNCCARLMFFIPLPGA